MPRRCGMLALCFLPFVQTFVACPRHRSLPAFFGRQLMTKDTLPVTATSTVPTYTEADSQVDLGHFWRNLSALPNELEKLRFLVRLGDEYASRQPEAGYFKSAKRKGWTRVPGCVSVVHVGVSFNEVGSKVQVEGSSDARMSMGLLAMVAQGLSGCSPEAILSLEPRKMAQSLGLRGSLTPGRLNGLENLLKTVQREVRRLSAEVKGPEHMLIHTSENPVVTTPTSQERPPHLPLMNGLLPDTAVLLSGGVDSSVALHMLLREGRKPKAFYLKIWLEDEVAHLNQCPWEEDLAYASAVCRQADIPLETISLQKEYWNQVVSHTVSEARAGRTPNPDILCNSLIKFGVFYDVLGGTFDRIATGHYARLKRRGELVQLFRSVDRAKDQTYFLSKLRQDQLARASFPVGEHSKAQVRQLAEQLNLPTKVRKDSQGICFLGKLKYDDFLRHYLGEAPGQIIWLEKGLKIGHHRGLWFHTIGQRKGLVPMLDNAYRPLGPWYVAAKDPTANLLYVTNTPEALDSNDARLTIQIEDMSWVEGSAPANLRQQDPKSVPLQVQLRHGPSARSAQVRPLDEDKSTLEVILAEADSPAPGQYAALYDEDACLGAGVVSEKSWAIPQGPARRPKR